MFLGKSVKTNFNGNSNQGHIQNTFNNLKWNSLQK